MSSDECGTALSYYSYTPAPPAPAGTQPFTDLDSFLKQDVLDTLHADLTAQIGELLDDEDFINREFRAACRKHADAVELQDRVSWPEEYGFKECRQNRGNPIYWQPNYNRTRLGCLAKFVEDLPFFEYTGKVTIIMNQPGVPGIEHVDHRCVCIYA